MTLIANQTLADTQARQNLNANLASLDQTQPDLRQWVIDQVLHVEWVFGRDRSLTAIDEFGQWAGACSLPARAAGAALGKMEIKGAVGCLLAPPHAAHLRAALDRLRPEQAIVAIVPDHRDLAIMLHCDDLSEAMAAHRLWFAAGPAWDVSLRNLLEQRPGLATPSQFIRTPDADPEDVQQLIVAAQQIFAEVSAARGAHVELLSKHPFEPQADRRRVCLVAPSRFRLWNDLGGTLLGVFDGNSELKVAHFDSDNPLCSSPLALLTAVRQCDVIVTANTGRSDLPGLVPDSIPWITWITAGRIPSRALAGPMDHLLVTDERLVKAATQSGWPASQIALAAWPALKAISGASGEKCLAIIADTSTLDTPGDLIEYSSQSILWESIRQELLNDPFVLTDIQGYLRNRMGRAGVGEQSFPAARFIDRLIVPAYQQGLARSLIAAGLPLRLFGAGWDAVSELASRASGELRSAEQLREAVSVSTALVHAWPTNLTHPIEAIPLPLVQRGNGTKDAFLQSARQALNGRLAPPSPSKHPISAGMFVRILHSTSATASDNMI